MKECIRRDASGCRSLVHARDHSAAIRGGVTLFPLANTRNYVWGKGREFSPRRGGYEERAWRSPHVIASPSRKCDQCARNPRFLRAGEKNRRGATNRRLPTSLQISNGGHACGQQVVLHIFAGGGQGAWRKIKYLFRAALAL